MCSLCLSIDKRAYNESIVLSGNWKLMKRPFYLYLLLLLTLYNCSKERDLLPDTETEKTLLHFSSVLFENDITRASGTTWDVGDEIGVFAVAHQSTLAPGNIIDNNENLPFVTTNGDGFFYAKSKNIYYPEKESSMDIVAYYPYKSDLNGYDYPVDITEQPEIFYSNNLTDVNKDNLQNNGLQFRRILSRVVFNVTSNTSDGSLEGLIVSINGAKTRASFSLSDGTLSVDEESVKSITMDISGSNMQKQASAILLPTDQGNDISAQFTIGDKTYTWTVPHALEAGKVYRYDIKLDGLSPVVGLSSPYLEIPVYTTSSTAPHSAAALHMVGNKNWLNSTYVTDSPNSIRNYSILFDTQNRVPYWVAFPLHPVYMASGNRTDAWEYDPIIPRSVQPNLYSGWNNQSLNRGHLLASADRNATREINKTTFYFTNMAPQNSSMNSGTWAQLEEKVRYWSEQSEYDTLYVVTGCILPKTPEPFTYVEDSEGKKSVVPKYLYKALLRKKNSTGAYSSIVFKMENENTGIPYTDSRNIISVAELESETGFTFFPNLPEGVAASVKRNKSMSPDWY